MHHYPKSIKLVRPLGVCCLDTILSGVPVCHPETIAGRYIPCCNPHILRDIGVVTRCFGRARKNRKSTRSNNGGPISDSREPKDPVSPGLVLLRPSNNVKDSLWCYSYKRIRRRTSKCDMTHAGTGGAQHASKSYCGNLDRFLYSGP